MARYQTQAVLRRRSKSARVLLVGVTLDGTFFPGSDAEATGPLVLTKGLVALAPLSAVTAADPARAAVTANADAVQAWAGLDDETPEVGLH